jgi:RNA exonuclease 4
MVGVGIRGQESALARVAIVNSYGNVIYDRYVLTNPKDKIVDYRTKWSGIRPEDLKPGKGLYSLRLFHTFFTHSFSFVHMSSSSFLITISFFF